MSMDQALQVLAELQSGKLARLKGDLIAIYGQIQAAAPNAKIYVTGVKHATKCGMNIHFMIWHLACNATVCAWRLSWILCQECNARQHINTLPRSSATPALHLLLMHLRQHKPDFWQFRKFCRISCSGEQPRQGSLWSSRLYQ